MHNIRHVKDGLFSVSLPNLEEDNYTVVVRGCAVDSGGVNSESEIGRESHCWMIHQVKYNDMYMKGCSLACHTNGCNHSDQTKASYWLLTAATLLTFFLPPLFTHACSKLFHILHN